MKDVQGLYTANCMNSLRNINGDMNNWNGIILLWIRRFNIFNLSTLSHRFNIMPIKNSSFLMMLNFLPCMVVTWVLLFCKNWSVCNWWPIYFLACLLYFDENLYSLNQNVAVVVFLNATFFSLNQIKTSLRSSRNNSGLAQFNKRNRCTVCMSGGNQRLTRSQ